MTTKILSFSVRLKLRRDLLFFCFLFDEVGIGDSKAKTKIFAQLCISALLLSQEF